MVLGELVPKNLAIARPLGTAKATQMLQRGFTAGMALPIRGLNGSANWLVRRLGIEPQEELRSARSAQSCPRWSPARVRGHARLGTAGLDAAVRGVRRADRGEMMTPRVHV